MIDYSQPVASVASRSWKMWFIATVLIYLWATLTFCYAVMLFRFLSVYINIYIWPPVHSEEMFTFTYLEYLKVLKSDNLHGVYEFAKGNGFPSSPWLRNGQAVLMVLIYAGCPVILTTVLQLKNSVLQELFKQVMKLLQGQSSVWESHSWIIAFY